MNMRHRCIAFLLSTAATLTFAAADKPAVPYANPHWADSAYPVIHAGSDFTALAGPRGPSRRLHDDEAQWKPLGPINSLAPLYSSPYPNGKRVIWVGGYDRIAKLDSDTLEVLATYAPGGSEFYSDDQVRRYVATLDKLGDQALVDYAMGVYLGPFRSSVATFYRVLSKDNELYISYRGTDGALALRAYGEADPANPASAIVLKREWKIPTDISRAATLMGVNLASDGRVIANTQDGVVFAVAPDFKSYAYLKLPRNESKDVKEVGDVFASFTRNGISIDDHGGIYVVTRDNLHRVQWTGSRLSLDEADGGWSVPYPNELGIGSGTTPNLMGWGPKEDHLVMMADASRGNKIMVFWRDKIPDDWKGLDGYDRRVAGVAPIRFGVSQNEQAQIENAPVIYGYGAFFNNTFPVQHLPAQGSPDKQWMAESLYMHVPGHEALGGAMLRWNSALRKLENGWQMQTNFVSTVCTVSGATELLYCWGARDREWTLEGVDWHTGKSAFHYTLGKSHRFNPLGAPIIVAPNGAVDCGCMGGMGLVRVKPR